MYSCFKAYDIRGKVPEDLNLDLAYNIACAYAKLFKETKVVVGYDARLESPEFAKIVAQGLIDQGVNVIDIGLCGTEEVTFAAFDQQVGGIMVTASHNPKGYNGMKLVAKGSRPLSSNELLMIRDLIIKQGEFPKAIRAGTIIQDLDKSRYINHLLSYVDIDSLKPLKIVANPGNGPAGLVVKELAKYLPFEFIYLHDEVDGNFPHGVPNPLLLENRKPTQNKVIQTPADLGIAWDGDFDRCFFFDETGRFIDGYYIVGLLAKAFLQKSPSEKIIHDPRLTWNTIDAVTKAGGTPIQSKAGHSFIKAQMRSENAIYGGEMSAHHYFRDFGYNDSGMIPWLLITNLLSSGIPFSKMVDNFMDTYPCSDEINFTLDNPQEVIERIYDYFLNDNPTIDKTDGISFSFPTWRFNIRASNTEPILRLNIESKGDKNLVSQKLELITSLVTGK